jgi:hypothetical protein
MGLSPNSLIYLGSITALEAADIAYSDIQNGKTSIELWQNASYNWGQNNLDADPMLDSNDFSLTWISPCIEAGTPDTSGLGLPEVDLGGMPRIVNTRVDLGAYEYQLALEIPNSKFQIPGDWLIYPNPAKGLVYVEIEAINGKTVIQVLGASGRVLSEIEMSSQRIMLNTEGLAPGLYFVRFLNYSGTSVKKLVIL